MSDILFEKQKKEIFARYQMNGTNWEINRLVACTLFAAIIWFVVWFFFKENNPNIWIWATLIALLLFFIMFKQTYVQLTHIDKKVERYLATRLPLITTTIVSLTGYYDSVINILRLSEEYIGDKYYSIKVNEFLKNVKERPEDLEGEVFNMFSKIPSANALFLSRAIIDIKNKGYDKELVMSLTKSVNREAEAYVKLKVQQVPLSFIKFGTFPIMVTTLLLLMMVMGMIGYGMSGVFQ